MIERRPFSQLGGADHGWLDAKHHFSFAGYHDPERMGWGSMRVWNDDTIAPQSGFPAHGHADMEIITCVRQGAITHQDDLGNRGRTEAGDVQVMSAGTGILHGEFSLEPGPTQIFQIWIQPNHRGAPPTWGAKPFPRGERAGRFAALASGMPGDADAPPIWTDARLGYLVPARGCVEVNGVTLQQRDGAAISDEAVVRVTALDDAELVLVDSAA